MTWQEIHQALRDKCAVLRAAENALEWHFCQGDVPSGCRPDLDDRDWPSVRMSYTWSGAAGDAWFRRTFRFPELVEGISTAGARIELPLIVPIHSAIHVDGVERVAEPSWLDTRAVPLAICERYQPEQSIQVTLHAYKGDGFGLFLIDHAEVSTVEEAAFQLEVLRNQLAFTRHIAYESHAADAAWRSAWEEAIARLDMAALDRNRWSEWWASVEAAREALEPLAFEAKTYVTHLVGHSHIDMNWLWTWEETVDVIRRDFAVADDLMERYPDFHFSQSQASTYKVMQERHPEVLERVKRRVAQGNWEVTATTWVEGDLNMECGESLARHLLLTRPYIERTFGVRPRICWEPDTFGHAATLPQLLRQVGVDCYYFCRAGQGQSLFWWEGLDGSRVLAFNDPLGYNGVVDAEAVASPVLDLSRRYGLKRGLFLYGVGDHGGGGTARDIQRARILDKTPFLPRAQMSDLFSFYDAARATLSLPVISGELNTTFEGCYTTHGDIKMYNRRCENGLLTAESLATLAKVLGGAAYPANELTESWHTLLFHHFHDILCGCAIGSTYKEAASRLEPALQTIRTVTTTAMKGLTERVDTGAGEGARCVVWNPLAWPRTDVVKLRKDAFGDIPSSLIDDAGNTLPVQVAGDELLFVAINVPPLSCRVYRPGDKPAPSDLVAEDDARLKNALLSFHVHPSSGAIDDMLDLAEKRPIDTMSTWHGVERKQNGGMINRLQLLWEEPHPMSAWNIGDITRTENLVRGAEVRVTERGPVRATVEVTHRVLNSTIIQRYRLYTGMRRVDIETELDWHERGGKDVDAPMLRALFRPQLRQGMATFEIPFAGLTRTASGDEVPALRWADLSDDDYGFSLLNNGKYGHSAQGTTLGLTLVRAAYEPDNLPDQGLQSFAYALYPHAGDWRQANTERRAAEFNQPVVVMATTGHAGPIKPGQAMLSCDPTNVMVTAVKQAESGEKAIVLRLVEMHGQEAQVRLRWAWPVQRVEEVNVAEEHRSELAFEKHGCELTLGKHKVMTLRLTLA